MVSTKTITRKKAQHKETKKQSLNELLNKDIRLFGSGMSDKNKEAFFAELHILLSSGIDMKSALELVAAEQKKEKDNQFYTRMKEAVIHGQSLSQAMEAMNAFSPYEINSIKIGEETGRLDFVLHEIALYYSRKIKQRRQVVQALTYPVLVLSVAILAIFFMMKFIVPMFADVFKRFGGDLPVITKFTLAASSVIGNLFLYGLIMTTIVAIVLYRNRSKIWCKKFLSGLLLRIPFLNEVLLKIYMVKLCQTMTLLLSSKIPLLTVIRLTKNMIRFYPIEVSLEDVSNSIVKGEALHTCMARHKVYPARFLSLVKVGEETNQLDNMFSKIAEQYHEEVEHRIGILSSLLEPLMIIFLGLIVGFILIAMYLPLFQLSSTVK